MPDEINETNNEEQPVEEAEVVDPQVVAHMEETAENPIKLPGGEGFRMPGKRE